MFANKRKTCLTTRGRLLFLPPQQQFQGIALARRLHLMAQFLNIFFWIVVLLSSFDEKAGVVVVAFIICPVLLIVYACIIRLLCEMIISVLLIPSLLAKNQPMGPAAPGGQMVNDSDLAAYGVSNGGNDMGAAV